MSPSPEVRLGVELGCPRDPVTSDPKMEALCPVPRPPLRHLTLSFWRSVRLPSSRGAPSLRRDGRPHRARCDLGSAACPRGEVSRVVCCPAGSHPGGPCRGLPKQEAPPALLAPLASWEGQADPPAPATPVGVWNPSHVSQEFS